MPTSLGQIHQTAAHALLDWEIVCLWAAVGMVLFGLFSDAGLGAQVAQAMAWGLGSARRGVVTEVRWIASSAVPTAFRG